MSRIMSIPERMEQQTNLAKAVYGKENVYHTDVEERFIVIYDEHNEEFLKLQFSAGGNYKGKEKLSKEEENRWKLFGGL